MLREWVARDDPRPVAILGGYGAGKSSLARRLVAAQAAEALADPLARRPVLIPLGDLARHSSLEGLLAEMLGGVSQLRAALPSMSIWLPVLEACSERIEFSPGTAVGLVAAISTGNDNLFFLLLALPRLHAGATGRDANWLAVTVAVAVLDRLFVRVRLDDATANGTVGDDATTRGSSPPWSSAGSTTIPTTGSSGSTAGG